MKQKITPINGNVLVEPMKQDSVSKGGIYIPETVDASKGLTRGKIIDIAADVDCRRKPLKVGRMVLFNKFSYSEVKIPPIAAGETERSLLFVHQDKIDGVIIDIEEPSPK